MKKISLSPRRSLAYFLIILILFAFITKESFAAPCYGTDMPKKGEWFKAFEANIVFKRKLDKSYGRLKSRQYFLDLSYGVSDKLTLDFKIGAGSFDHKPTDSYEIDYGTHFAGGYGFRIGVFDNPDQGLKGVVGFQHISLHPPTEKIEGDKNEAILDYWQISGLISKDFRFFTPYLGVKLSRCDVIHKLNREINRNKSD